MSTEGIDQLPVVQESGHVLGMVSLGNLMSKILARLIDETTPVSKAAYDQFRKVGPTTVCQCSATDTLSLQAQNEIRRQWHLHLSGNSCAIYRSPRP